LKHWNGNLMELLDIPFSSFVHLWKSSQIYEDNSIHCGGFGEVDDLSCNSLRHDFFFNYSSLVYMVSENRVFSRHVLFLGSLAWPSAKHDRNLQNLL
jgi:hypothetical protein